MKKISQTTMAPSGSTVSRPGVHAKTKNSSNKNSKNYKKPYNGQGR
jgi:hypothetical protein